MSNSIDLEISEWNRPVTWMVRYSWYGGQSINWCLYSTQEEATKHAIWAALGNADWELFPILPVDRILMKIGTHRGRSS